MNSEEMDYYNDADGPKVYYKEFVDYYPDVKLENNRTSLEDDYLLPTNLKRIYHETLSVLNSNKPVLTAIGIRAIIETICKDRNANGKNLYDKINDLVSKGVLTQDGADILHQLRNLGNESAHEIKPHTSNQLNLAFDVIEHLLKGVYIIPYHARNEFK